MRLAVKSFNAAYAAGAKWYEAARVCWEAGNEALPVAVCEMENAYDKAFELCTPAGKKLLGAFLFDQPLPADLDERRYGGENFTLEGLLTEIEAAI